MNQDLLIREIKKKNRISNILIALGVIFDLIPRILTIHMTSSFLMGSLTGQLIIRDGVLMLSAFILKAICSYYSTSRAHNAAYTTLTDLRLRLIGHLKRLPLGFFQERKVGNLTNIVEHDVEQVEFYLAHGLPEIMSATLLPAVIFIAMLFLDWRLALLMVSTLPLMLLTKRLSASIWEKNQRTFADSTKTMQENMVEYIQVMAVIKAFAREEKRTEKTIGLAREYVGAARKAAAGVSISMGFLDIFMEGGVVLMMILGSSFLAAGEISVPVFILSVILGGSFTASIGKAATLQHYGIVFNQSMKEVGSVLDTPAQDRKEIKMDILDGDIKVCNLDFAYPGKEHALKGINITFPKGSRSALVGASGCGKSTLSNLLMGFWEPERGSIKISDVDIQAISEKQLNSMIGIVQQDPFLFNMSIEDNIRLGKQNASQDEVIEAAKKARIHEFISMLPQGYETKVGEAGVKFSGGDKQRIAIARMILKDAPIMIFDEATAAVDAENERLIKEAIEDLSRDKTVIMITHHLNTIRDVDQIIVMDAGEIVHIGRHHELMEGCQLYQKLVSHQNQVDYPNIREE